MEQELNDISERNQDNFNEADFVLDKINIFNERFRDDFNDFFI